MNNKWGAVCIDDVQARFRGERPETCRGNAVRRWTLSRQRYGYVTRHRIRTETGQLADTEYLVRECPLDQEKHGAYLRADSPGLENQLTGGANDGFPCAGNSGPIKEKEI